MSQYISCKSFNEFKSLCEERKNLDVEKIEKAYLFAKKIHANQKRKSGEPYIIHPLHVAEITLKIGGDEKMICASLLHDTIEDFDGNREIVKQDIYEQFGEDVLFFVDALSKNYTIGDKDERYESFMKQIEEAFTMDMSVFFLKAADILHNMSTLESLPPKKQEKWINELKFRYAPLFKKYFHRISMHYRNMYENLINEIEKTIEQYESKKLKK